MGLDHNFYVFSKKDYDYEYVSNGIIVKNKNENEQYVFPYDNASDFHVADMNTFSDYSVEEVHGTDDVFIIVEVY